MRRLLSFEGVEEGGECKRRSEHLVALGGREPQKRSQRSIGKERQVIDPGEDNRFTERDRNAYLFEACLLCGGTAGERTERRVAPRDGKPAQPAC